MPRGKQCLLLSCLALVVVCTAPAWAGMPAPLPTEPEWVFRDKVLRLNEPVRVRVQTISFFLLAFLGSAAVVRWLWNFVQADFPSLPRLSYGKAVAGVLLWGLLFIIVLTMISGARELMTPGAWEKQGFTYKLAKAAPESDSQSVRREQLERLRTALWRHAATHNGLFPATQDNAAIPTELWNIPEAGTLRFIYVPGLSASQVPAPLVYEPELDPAPRWVLMTDGEIHALKPAELRDALAKGTKP